MNQDQDNIRSIKKRANNIQGVIDFFSIILIILVVAIFIALVFVFVASPERFNAVKGSLNWNVTYKLTNDSSFFINIPFKIIQPIGGSMFSAKYAALTGLFTIFINLSFVLYGINQVANILKSTANDITPFIMKNVKRLKKLAYTIIIYSVVVDLLSSLLCSIFVTKIYNLDLSNIHLSGILIGWLILIISDIFKYGVFLQKEFDTTL
jgi:hypothetical protein